MEDAIPLVFRFCAYVMFGFAMEVTFAVHGIEVLMGARIERRVPKRYLEGFVSLWMAPLHGFGLLFAIEPLHALIVDWAWPLRFLVWAAAFTVAEIGWGFICDKLLGFFPWDYYPRSPYRIGRRGYSLWTLVPFWGFAGMVVEVYSDLLIALSPHVVTFFLG